MNFKGGQNEKTISIQSKLLIFTFLMTIVITAALTSISSTIAHINLKNSSTALYETQNTGLSEALVHRLQAQINCLYLYSDNQDLIQLL